MGKLAFLFIIIFIIIIIIFSVTLISYLAIILKKIDDSVFRLTKYNSVLTVLYVVMLFFNIHFSICYNVCSFGN